MRRIQILYLLSFLVLIQCENVFVNENSGAIVSAVIEENDLVIRNGLHFDVYYFAINKETSYVVDWIPIPLDEVKISSNDTRVLSTDVIFDYQSDKPVVVYIYGNNQEYWETIEIQP